MVHSALIKHFGLTPDDLRRVFTCKDASNDDHKIREKFESRVMSALTDGMARGLRHAAMYQAVDMAWDSKPIQREMIPLMLWAEGKLKIEGLTKTLTGMSRETAAKYIKQTENDGPSVQMPRLLETPLNIIRTYTTRRVAAQSARFANLWPYFRYEPRGTDDVAKLRGDALSQRVDIMADAYNYRHKGTQAVRHQFLYGRSVMFARSGWDAVTGWRPKNLNLEAEELEVESYVKRDGVDLVMPHPTRTFWDNSAPLADINTDTGPAWIGYWDVVRYGTIEDGNYWNVDAISTSETLVQLLDSNPGYAHYYYDPKILVWPEFSDNPAASNDRLRRIGIYGDSDRDKAVVIGQIYFKVNPHHEKLGGNKKGARLNMDVWLRLTVAGDYTVVGAEVMPSIPACYGGFNENDDREANISMAMELMPYQDQLSNLMTQMRAVLNTGLSQIWAIDQDAMDPEVKKYMEKAIENGDLFVKPHAFWYSGSKLRQLGMQTPDQNPRALLQIIQADMRQSLVSIYDAIDKVLNLADRIIILSPNEGGQPINRVTSAREVTEISGTTNAIHSFAADGIDEQRAALKKLIYESLIACSTQPVRVPVTKRYTKATIRAAGFEFEDNEKYKDLPDSAFVPLKTTVIGAVKDLLYDYLFDSRDGGERHINAQGAEVLATLIAQVLQVPPIAQAMGKRRMFEIFNELFRMSGTGVDLKLEIEDGENEAMPVDGEGGGLEQRMQQIEQVVQQIMQALAPAQGQPGPAADMPPPDMPTGTGPTPAALMEA